MKPKPKRLLDKRYHGDEGAVFPDEFISDDEVAIFVKEHLRFIDRFRLRRIVYATQVGFAMLATHKVPDEEFTFF